MLSLKSGGGVASLSLALPAGNRAVSEAPGSLWTMHFGGFVFQTQAAVWGKGAVLAQAAARVVGGFGASCDQKSP